MRAGRTGLLLATLLSAGVLTACGSATVENDPGADASVAPLERAPRATTEQPEDGDADAPAAPAQPQPRDQRAQEVSEVPDPAPERSEEDSAFLTAVAEGGVDVAGVEDQLIGAALTVCRSEGGDSSDIAEQQERDAGTVTVGAVAGQLLEQGRTELEQEETVALIENEARAAYC